MALVTKFKRFAFESRSVKPGIPLQSAPLPRTHYRQSAATACRPAAPFPTIPATPRTFACILPVRQSRDPALCFVGKIYRKFVAKQNKEKGRFACKMLLTNRDKGSRRNETLGDVDGGDRRCFGGVLFLSTSSSSPTPARQSREAAAYWCCRGTSTSLNAPSAHWPVCGAARQKWIADPFTGTMIPCLSPGNPRGATRGLWQVTVPLVWAVPQWAVPQWRGHHGRRRSLIIFTLT